MPVETERTVPAAGPVIGEAEIAAAVRVLRSGRVVQGPEVAASREYADRFSRNVTLKPLIGRLTELAARRRGACGTGWFR